MLKPIDLVLLDLGNTLYHDPKPWPDILKRAEAALWKSLRASGVKDEPREVYGQHETLIDFYNSNHRKDLVEASTAVVLGDLLRRNGHHVSEDAVGAALRAMYSVTRTNWILEPEAIPLLQRLRESGFHLGVITNAADEENTQTLIDNGKIRDFLEFIVSSARYGKRKPDPGIFQLALDHFAIHGNRAVMVGDTYEADIIGAKTLGIHTIWIRHGGSEHDQAHPAADAVVTTLNEIPQLISR